MNSKQCAQLVTGTLTLLALVACGVVADPSRTSNTKRANLENVCPSANIEMPDLPAGIIGGDVVTPTSFPARQTVMVVQALGPANMITCTGSLVAPDVVLTAAHCVTAENTQHTFVVFKVRPNESPLDPTDPQQVANADAVRVHPHYRSTGHGEVGNCSVADASGRGDIALVHLRTPAPKTMAISQLIQEPFSWTDLDNVIVAGYGDTAGGLAKQQDEVALRSTTLQPLRRLEVEMIRVRSPLPASTFAHMFDTSENAENIWLNQMKGHGVCNGDSGGPAFIMKDGKTYQIGVLSAVTGSGAQRCNGFGLETNVQFYRDWLEQTFEQLEGPNSHRRLFR